MADDWFRNRTWSKSTSEAFFKRLNRARTPENKAQYLRIQAYHLMKEGKPSDLEPAIDLLRLQLDSYPSRLQTAITWDQLAECYSRLDQPEAAIGAYREAFNAMRAFPNVRTNSAEAYAEFSIRCDRPDLYAEAISLLAEFPSDDLFPVRTFRRHACLAVMLHANGRGEEAAQHRAIALKAAEADSSNARKHRKLGLVGREQRWLINRLNQLD
jgi:tetratricopeptide (TPR) repeat protein